MNQRLMILIATVAVFTSNRSAMGFDPADLKRALNGTKDLYKVDLEKAQLSKVNFSQADLYMANFSGADLR
jgi:uncharacterized protein YjbI with pentapeptide repeats